MRENVICFKAGNQLAVIGNKEFLIIEGNCSADELKEVVDSYKATEEEIKKLMLKNRTYANKDIMEKILNEK